MSARRLPVVVALLLALVGLVAFGTERRGVPDSAFAFLDDPGMPVAPTAAGITTSWFCPGVPASDRRGGDVVVTNIGDVPLRGRLTVFSTNDPPSAEPVQVAVRDSVVYRLEEIAEGDYLVALVELDTGLGIVEQQVRHPNGLSISPCSNAASSVWYLADGLTEQAGYDLVITNPFPDYTNVSIVIATEAGARTPADLQSLTIPGRSVTKIDLEEFGLRDEPRVSITVAAAPHRVVVGRAQNYRGGGRGGYSMSLAAPSLDDYWLFPDGEAGNGIQESVVVYNPTDALSTVTLQVFTEQRPGPEFVGTEEYDVPAGDTLVIDVDALEGLPDGRHNLRLTTGTIPVVADLVISRTLTSGTATAVSPGSRLASTRWWAPSPITESSENALVVANQTGVAGVVTVFALGPGGLLPVPGLEELPLAAPDEEGVGGTLVVDLTSTEVVGKPVLVAATVDVAVGRRPLRGGALRGRTAVLGLPEIVTE